MSDGFNCCGGNDATPREHTADCPRYAWREHFNVLQAEVDSLRAQLEFYEARATKVEKLCLDAALSAAGLAGSTRK
jgi:hypothetical protein